MEMEHRTIQLHKTHWKGIKPASEGSVALIFFQYCLFEGKSILMVSIFVKQKTMKPKEAMAVCSVILFSADLGRILLKAKQCDFEILFLSLGFLLK